MYSGGHFHAWLFTTGAWSLSVVWWTRQTPEGAKVMKVFISVDLEGISCVVCPVETQLAGLEYEKARVLMTAEASAAAEGARAAGASEVIVADGHGHMRNLLPEALPDYVRLVRGANRPWSMMQGLNSDVDAVLMIGYHAQAGTAGGVMNHTFLGRVIRAVHVNGIAVGETGFNAALAGSLDVPVAMVSGDQALSDEVAELLPWAERVVVKEGITSWSASNLAPEKAREAIRNGVRAALARLSHMQPLRVAAPVVLQVDFFRPLQADLAAIVPGVTRAGSVTVGFTGADMAEVNRALQTILGVTVATNEGYG